MLLSALLQVGAEEQAATLLARNPAAHAALDDPDHVALLLRTLQDAGAEEQARTLVDRLPAEGCYGLFANKLATRRYTSSDANSTEAQPPPGGGVTWTSRKPDLLKTGIPQSLPRDLITNFPQTQAHLVQKNLLRASRGLSAFVSRSAPNGGTARSNRDSGLSRSVTPVAARELCGVASRFRDLQGPRMVAT
jgi:hypothetical protein